MPRTTIDIDADITAVQAAIGTGALRVRYSDGREVVYRSFDELRRTLAALSDERAVAIGASREPRTSFVAHTRE